MKLSPMAIREFQEIYAKKRGIELTDEEAEIMANKLMQIAVLALKDN